jgi:hypothetical protein
MKNQQQIKIFPVGREKTAAIISKGNSEDEVT